MMKRYFIALVLIAFSAVASAENLYQVYQHALQSDPVLQASEANYLAIMENKPQALAALKPQVTVSASGGANLEHQNTTTSSGTSDFVNGAYTLSLSKSIYDNVLDARVDQAVASIAQAKSSLMVDRQDLIIRVAEAYFTYLKAEDNLKFTRAEKEAIGRQLKQVKAYFEAGQSAITDVKEAQARFDSAVAQQVLANQQFDIAKEGIKAISGRYYKRLLSARLNTPLIPPQPNRIEAWTQKALANSQQIAVLKHAVRVAQSEVARQRATRDPTVDLVAKHNGSVNRLDIDSDTFGASVGVQLTMPLYRGGAIASGIRQARHNLHQAQYQLESSKRQVVQQTRSAYLSVVSGIAQAKALQQALVSTKTAAKASQAGFEVGTRTAVDVLLSLRETFRAQRDYSVSRYDYLLNTLRLKQATGLLNVRDLQQINGLLQRGR